jgi:hypothetical protein
VTVRQAREIARQWMLDEAGRIPGFWGAYTAGSSNWLPDEANLATSSDLDIMVVLEDQDQAGRRGKFIYLGTLLEVSCLGSNQFQSPQQILRDYHLAPSFRTTKVMFDPLGYLAPLLAAVVHDYAKAGWVRRRCADASTKILTHLRSINPNAALHDQVIACLFAAGVTTHVLLVAGLKNPTIRTRYVAVENLLADYGRLDFHETLLQLLGSARISPQRAVEHLARLKQIFDTAGKAVKTQFTFASDLNQFARPAAIDAMGELVGRGYHREAMFWLAVTHSRWQKVLSADAPGDLTTRFKNDYQELVGDLGLGTFDDLQRRRREIEGFLPQVAELAEHILARNPEIEAENGERVRA